MMVFIGVGIDPDVYTAGDRPSGDAATFNGRIGIKESQIATDFLASKIIEAKPHLTNSIIPVMSNIFRIAY